MYFLFFPLFLVPEALNLCLSKSTLPSYLLPILCDDSVIILLGS